MKKEHEPIQAGLTNQQLLSVSKCTVFKNRKAATAHFNYFFFLSSIAILSTFLRAFGWCYANIMLTASGQFTDGRCSKAPPYWLDFVLPLFGNFSTAWNWCTIKCTFVRLWILLCRFNADSIQTIHQWLMANASTRVLMSSRDSCPWLWLQQGCTSKAGKPAVGNEGQPMLNPI